MLVQSIAQKQDIFQTVKEIPFADIFQAFYGGEVRRNKTVCPFHAERAPSLHVYADGFRCFGCGEAGDAVDFVARLNGIRAIDAAKQIAEHFGLQVDRPLSREEAAQARQQRQEREQEKELHRALETWSAATTWKIRTVTGAIYSLFEMYGLDVPSDILEIVHCREQFEYWADVLTAGSDDERLELYRWQELRRWFN